MTKSKKSDKNIRIALLIVATVILFYFISDFGGDKQNSDGKSAGSNSNPRENSAHDTDNLINDKNLFFNTDGDTVSPILGLPDEILADGVYLWRGKSIILKSDTKAVVHLLMVDSNNSNNNLYISPVLSFNSIFGFEKLSEIVTRQEKSGKKVLAAINGGFCYQYGQPSGMVVIDGEVVCAPASNYPSLLISDGKAIIVEAGINVNAAITAKSEASAITARNGNSSIIEKISIHFVNREDNFIIEKLKQKLPFTVLYTPFFGSRNRAVNDNFTVIIRNGSITGFYKGQGETKIPSDGILLTFYSELNSTPLKAIMNQLKTGMKVELNISLIQNSGSDSLTIIYPLSGEEQKRSFQAYECGTWLVKEGKSVVPEYDKWIGTLNNRDPRTAVAVNQKGELLFIVVDGRQPGYSDGMTAKEITNFLISIGAVNAAMLDGGASSEMIAAERIINRPSSKGNNERALGSGLFIFEE